MRSLAALLVFVASTASAQIPRSAYQFERPLIANARAVWGLNAPIATLAAQVHQESSWRPDAKSPYAGGLAQFTPSTADWISKLYANELGINQPYEPGWALRALARYDKFLYDRQQADTDCDRWAFTLVSYNGGEGTLNREKRLAANPRRYWGSVELKRSRNEMAYTESRGYPRRILLVLQPRYHTWGIGVDCGGVK